MKDLKTYMKEKGFIHLVGTVSINQEGKVWLEIDNEFTKRIKSDNKT